MIRTAALGLAVVAFAASGCSSSGGGSAPSQSKVEAKLKSDTTVTSALSSLSSNKNALDLAYTCIAKALVADADPSGLNDYVNGKKNISDLGGKAKGSAEKVKTDVQGCVKNGVQQGSASPSA